MPRREDISPRDFAGLLRNSALLKVVDGGLDYEIRVVGDAHVEAHGVSFREGRLSTVVAHFPGYGTAVKNVCDRVCSRARPVALRGWLGMPEDDHPMLHHESVFLPLGTKSHADHILVVSTYMRGVGPGRSSANRS